MKFKPRNKKVLVRSTAALGALLICGGAITSSPLVMHADDTTSTHTETVAPTGTTLDNTKWTAVDKAKTITRTIHYIDEDGKTVAPDVVETHTGEVFTTKNGDQTVNRAFTIVNGVATNVVPKFASVVSPSVRGYKLKSTQYSTIPEQGWSLDGTQTKDPKTGFYSNLSQDEVINVVYTKDPTTALKDEVPVPGYTVLNVKNMTRTINYVDEEGNKLADSAVETVKYETVASDKLTPKEQQDEKNQKVAVVQVLRDTNGNVTSENTSILSTPAYKLKDVKSPKIAGMKLQNKKFATLTGQYMWLSDQPYVHATLDNGLPQYM
ncbi:MAG: MucBP domain-containing protein, partial [Lactobacillus crispatus]|nr:MucBP domain-containing protein [Lactobacillus crispatus]